MVPRYQSVNPAKELHSFLRTGMMIFMPLPPVLRSGELVSEDSTRRRIDVAGMALPARDADVGDARPNESDAHILHRRELGEPHLAELGIEEIHVRLAGWIPAMVLACDDILAE